MDEKMNSWLYRVISKWDKTPAVSNNAKMDTSNSNLAHEGTQQLLLHRRRFSVEKRWTKRPRLLLFVAQSWTWIRFARQSHILPSRELCRTGIGWIHSEQSNQVRKRRAIGTLKINRRTGRNLLIQKNHGSVQIGKWKGWRLIGGGIELL